MRFPSALFAVARRSALLLACSWMQPDEHLVAALLAAGAPADVQDRPGAATPLMLTLQAGHQGIAALLLKHTRQVRRAWWAWRLDL